MSTYEYTTPVLPDQLRAAWDANEGGIQDLHAQYAHMALKDIVAVGDPHSDHPLVREVVPGDDRAIVINGDPAKGVSLHGLSHEQAWKPSKMIQTFMYHDLNNPEGLTVVLPNNSLVDRYYKHTPEELERLKAGDPRAFAERRMRVVEAALEPYTDIGEVTTDGGSLGGLLALNLAEVALSSDKIQVVEVNAFEVPSGERTPKELNKDFTKSGGPGPQRAAIADAAIPALSKALRADRLAMDYGRFLGAMIVGKDNKALKLMMTNPHVGETIDRLMSEDPDVIVNLGRVAGSTMDGISPLSYGDRFHDNLYTGAGAHAHATLDNVVAYAMTARR